MLSVQYCVTTFVWDRLHPVMKDGVEADAILFYYGC